jgi:hypothetical protein
MTLAELQILINANTSGLNDGLHQAEGKLDSFHKVAGGVVKKVGLLFAGLKIGEYIKDSITEGMDAIESENLFGVAMGNMADQARAFSENLQAQFGLNGYEVRKNTANFYMMAEGLGFASGQAYDMATKMTQLSYDMASFRNRSPQDTFDALSGAMVGNTERLRGMGIVLNEHMIKQQAYKMGLATTGKELDQTAKSMAVYQLVMQQTSKDQGDLARTINSPANQLRVLRSQLELLRISIGRAFMPIAQIVLPLLNEFVRGLVTVTGYVAQFMEALFGTSPAATQTANTAVDMAKGYDQLGTSIEGAAKKAKGSVAGFDQVNTLSMPDSGAGAGSGAGGGGGISMPPLDTTTGTGAVNEMSTKIKKFAEDTKAVLALIWKPFKDSWDKYGPEVKKDVETIWNDIKQMALKLGETLKNIWENPATAKAIDALVGTFTALFHIITRIWDEIIKPAWMAFFNMLDPTKNPAMQGFYDKIALCLVKVKEFCEYLGGDGFKYVQGFILLLAAFEISSFVLSFVGLGSAASLVASGFSALGTALFPATTMLRNLLAASGESLGVWGTLKAALGEIGVLLSGTAVTIAGVAVPVWAVIAAIAALVAGFIYAWNNVDGFKQFFVDSWEQIKAATKEAIDAIVKSAKEAWVYIKPVIDDLWKILKSLWDDLLKPICGFIIDVLVVAFKLIAETIKVIVIVAITVLKVAFTGIIDIIKGVMAVLGPLTSAVSGGLSSSFKGLGSIVTNIRGIFSGLVDFISGVFTGNWSKAWNGVVSIFKNIVGGIANIFKLPINGMIGLINGFLNGLNRIKIPDWVPGVGGKGFNIPNIPKLAQGGIIDRPTVAQIGEAGPEMVVPLKNTAFVDTLASALGNAVMVAMSASGSNKNGEQPIVLKVNDTVLGEVVINAINKVSKSAGESLLVY